MKKNLFKGLVFGAVAATSALFAACMGDNTASAPKDAQLVIGMGLQDVDKAGKGLSKSSTIQLAKLVVTMTSNANTPDVIRDTILPGNNGFTATSTDSQTVSKSYAIKPLRNWTIEVKTLDANDSVIHVKSATANNIQVGETRNVTISLVSKFVMYVAKFQLPDSLRATGTSQAQVLNVNRFMMVVDGDTVVDSSKVSGYFAATPTVHSIQYDYVKADTTHQLELYIFGDINGWPSDKPLFGDTLVVAPGPDTTYTPTLPWTGPGSPNDPNYNPNNPGGANKALTIKIGKVGIVIFEPTVPGTVFGKRK